MSNFFIYIDNQDCIGVNNDFTLNLSSFNFESGTQCSVSLDSAIFYNLQYNINSNNNTIIFRENSGVVSATATITAGNYNSTTILTAIVSAMNSATLNALTYTCTYSATNGFITITPSSTNIKIMSSNSVLGLAIGSSFTSSVSSTYPMNLGGVEYMNVISSVRTNNMSSSFNQTGLIQRIPLYQGFGNIIYWQAQTDNNAIICDHQDLDNIRIQLMNPDGTQYNNGNGRVSLVLKCALIYD